MTYFREVMQRYEGSHNFHNFTVGVEYGERSSRRFMKTIKVGSSVMHVLWPAVDIG